MGSSLHHQVIEAELGSQNLAQALQTVTPKNPPAKVVFQPGVPGRPVYVNNAASVTRQSGVRSPDMLETPSPKLGINKEK